MTVREFEHMHTHARATEQLWSAANKLAINHVQRVPGAQPTHGVQRWCARPTTRETTASPHYL